MMAIIVSISSSLMRKPKFGLVTCLDKRTVGGDKNKGSKTTPSRAGKKGSKVQESKKVTKYSTYADKKKGDADPSAQQNKGHTKKVRKLIKKKQSLDVVDRSSVFKSTTIVLRPKTSGHSPLERQRRRSSSRTAITSLKTWLNAVVAFHGRAVAGKEAVDRTEKSFDLEPIARREEFKIERLTLSSIGYFENVSGSLEDSHHLKSSDSHASQVGVFDNGAFVCVGEQDDYRTVLTIDDICKDNVIWVTNSSANLIDDGEKGAEEIPPKHSDEKAAEKLPDKHDSTSGESSWKFFLQVVFPFLIAGGGMVGAGVLLDVVKHWPLFTTVPETFILVPALLGLKGNLEMTLASRLSTLANLGKMETREQQFKVLYSNMALLQIQSTCVAFFASVLALAITSIKNEKFDIAHAAMLCATSMTTASVASLLLGLLMTMVVIVARRLHIDPDNVTTPIAASLGDVTTLFALVTFGTMFLNARDATPWVNPAAIVSFFAASPFWFWLTTRDHETIKVLKTGWLPVISAMFISSGGGFILEATIGGYPGIAVFQPVINGVGGNLVAVQASRLSTALHQTGTMGRLLSGTPMSFLSLRRAFFSNDVDSRSARVLLAMVIPGHLIFTLAIYLAKAGSINVTVWFLVAYLLVAIIQVFMLLFICQWLVRLMWKRKIDPDNCAIPYLTALGDLSGTGLLAVAFILLSAVGGYSV
uniref:SLC41A/MgtE integral membrane domain-containing protein n=1 Tax=Plectus sambesii TaxID=2011161 RepID=A0A914WKS0_9BILA